MTTERPAAHELQARIGELWDFDDPLVSEQRFRAAAAAEADAVPRDVLVTQIARALGLQGRYAEALELLETLEPSSAPELGVRIHLERGRVLNSSGDPAAARPEFEAAVTRAEEQRLEFLAVDAIHMIAIVAPADEQRALHARAIAMAEAATDPRARAWLASLYNNAGWTHFDAGEHDEALRLFKLALDERIRNGKAREIGIARWAVARTMRALGQTAAALAIQEELQRTNADAGIDDPYVSEELGECLLALGRDADARPHLAAALQGLSADGWTSEHEPERLERLRELAGA